MKEQEEIFWAEAGCLGQWGECDHGGQGSEKELACWTRAHSHGCLTRATEATLRVLEEMNSEKTKKRCVKNFLEGTENKHRYHHWAKDHQQQLWVLLSPSLRIDAQQALQRSTYRDTQKHMCATA